MKTEDDFLAAHEAGDLVFFAGAGASFDSRAASPPAVLAASAAVFLPAGPRFGRLVEDVLTGAGVPGTSLRGIQPEIFYEHLLSLCDDRQALVLWKVLSPEWLAARGERLRPNANHLAIASYAARTGLPVFTTNFDTLFEAAARELGVEPEVVLPAATGAPEDVGLSPGRVRVFKLHGTISLDGRDRLDTLATTMEAITAVNQPMIGRIARLVRDRALAFVGYSGCDIDYFPAIADLPLDRPPFWFVPPGDEVTLEHARRIGARVIDRYPSQLFAARHPQFPVRTEGPDPVTLLERLKAEVPVSLTSAQKRLLLALCLQSLGRNPQAADIAGDLLADGRLPGARDRALALLLRARAQDCLSQYRQSAASADAAFRLVQEACRTRAVRPAEAAALQARALYQRAMARQQQIGPTIRLGSPELDWSPPLPRMLLRLLAGLWTSARLLRLSRRLHPGGARTAGGTRAEHAINDHAMMLTGRVISLLEVCRLAHAPLISPLLQGAVGQLLRRATATGDYFVYAGAHKYLRRLRGAALENPAGETYGLLRDPLNYALVRRDAGVRLLRQGRPDLAAAEFRAAAQCARACGSRATSIKALLGLARCSAATPDDLKEVAALGPLVEGAGYERFWSARVAPFLRRAGGR